MTDFFSTAPIWVNGALVPRDQFHLDPADEGLLFGRGLFETTRTFAGRPWRWSAHRQRLRSTAGQLNIPIDETQIPTADQVANFVASLFQTNRHSTLEDVTIRLNITAGSANMPGSVWMAARALPPTEFSTYIAVNFPTPVSSNDPYSTYKTFHYAQRAQARQHAQQQNAQASLLFDESHHLLEAHHANVFLLLDNNWHTPSLRAGILPGTTRQFMIDFFDETIIQRDVSLNDLAQAQALMLTNSVAGALVVSHWKIQEATIAYSIDDSRVLKFKEFLRKTQEPTHPLFDGPSKP